MGLEQTIAHVNSAVFIVRNIYYFIIDYNRLENNLILLQIKYENYHIKFHDIKI